MLERERHRLILKAVEERGVCATGDLVDLLGASEATVRRDIAAMAARGEVRRVRGGVEALRPKPQLQLAGAPFEVRRKARVQQKRAIARAAAALIEPNESIILNTGTTTLHMVEFLADKNLDILTNSFPIAAQLIGHGRNRVTLPGGTVYREQGIILSPFDNDVIGNFWAKRLFTGCYGINGFGMMEADPLIAQAEVKLLERADQIVVLADSRKLEQRSSMIVAPLERIAALITDDGADEAALQPLRAAGVEIVIADATEAGGLVDVA
ncbi:DeoR/GlpR family DNA-binding transcription regulator [Marinivivus vitaminiproducens]|uniref:DeoR/GlpR family DNA-binding transcription regulator n=1 Tax=Marinivivus vitaminiproducens TaxID=3035935 RepID=UPI00279BAE76|nr:DeoR/GlpR family DNA-binding transcription regulator [Geminicoccaceae bacterium SCSIO 64248]